jgi:hypothetical protein
MRSAFLYTTGSPWRRENPDSSLIRNGHFITVLTTVKRLETIRSHDKHGT